ncbi:MAG: hypothetical protein WCI48_06335 [Bacteroidota bacterium]
MLIVKLKNLLYSQNLSKKPGIAEIARVFVLLLSLYCSSHSYARDSFKIRLSDSLKSSLKGFYVEKIINATREDSCIGFVQVGAVNKLVPAYLTPSIQYAFSDLIMHSFPYSAGLKPLIIRINELYIYEITSANTELSSIELSLSFITRSDTLYFDEYLAGVAFDRHALDVTHQHEGNIIAAIEKCFNNFSSRMLNGKLSHRQVPQSELGKNPLMHTDEFPIMALKQVPKCIFRTYSDFREYKPDTGIQFTVKYTTYKRDSMLVQAKIYGLPWDSLEHIWGFSDGPNPFIRVGKIFYRLKLKNGEYITRIFVTDAGRSGNAEVNAGALVAATVIGGVIGGAIAGGIMGAAAANEVGKYKLDFASGKLIVRPIPDYMRIQSTMIFRLSSSSRSGIPLTIFYGDKKLATLNQDDYLKLIVPSGHNTIKLKCIPGNGATTELEFAVRLFHTDVFLLKVRKSLEVEVFPAFDEVRKSVLESMEEDKTVVVNL